MRFEDHDRAAPVRSPERRRDGKESGRPPATAAEGPAALFTTFAARLDVDELEVAVLHALADGLARVSALVRIGDDPTPSRLGGGRTQRAWTPADEERRILACPIGASRERLGFIGYVHDQALSVVLSAAEERLVLLADLLVVPARNALRHRAALELAYKDPLTDLYNRRAFTDHLEREEQRAARSRRPLSIVLLDLDRLKDVNDRWGHDTGDRSLCALADVLRRAVRRGDIVARLGGDEFAILLPDTGASEARRIGIRVQEGLAVRRVPCGEGAVLQDMRVSFGVAALAEAGDSSKMLEIADAELFASKRSRRSGADATAAAAGPRGEVGP